MAGASALALTSLVAVGVSAPSVPQTVNATSNYSYTFNSNKLLWNNFVSTGNGHVPSTFGTQSLSGHNPIKEAVMSNTISTQGTSSCNLVLLGSTSGTTSDNANYYNAKIAAVAGFNGLSSVSGILTFSAGYTCTTMYVTLYDANFNSVGRQTVIGGTATSINISVAKNSGSSALWLEITVGAHCASLTSDQIVITLASLTVNWSC